MNTCVPICTRVIIVTVACTLAQRSLVTWTPAAPIHRGFWAIAQPAALPRVATTTAATGQHLVGTTGWGNARRARVRVCLSACGAFAGDVLVAAAGGFNAVAARFGVT